MNDEIKREQLENGVVLYSGDFPLGTDAVRLAAFAAVPKGAAVCDLCAGSGAVGLLMLAREPSLTVTAVELRAEACALMERSVAESGLEERFRVLRGDVRAIRELLPAGSFRYVVCNPPYYPVGSGYVPEDEARAVARTELRCTLEDACAAAAWLLRTGGCLWMVHRPERLTDLLCSLRANGLEPKVLKPICPNPDKPPSLVLVKAIRGGKPGLMWQSTL
jgi:tRNA1(Val) A37 N6-methylase TrmN6